ncbi:MAG TPA: heavy metal transporter [Firmicutes bacterium]|nr:heavy metal transporter [Bacillota bacterium]
MKKVFNIDVDCPVCAQKCEDAINKMDTIKSCKVNFITKKMIIEADDLDKVMKDVVKTAKKVDSDIEIDY